MSFQQSYDAVIKKNKSLLCIGLDPEYNFLPFEIRQKQEDPLFEFNKAIIDSTYDLVCAYKMHLAYYLAEGDKGIWQLKKTIDHIKHTHTGIPVILDAKIGDLTHANEEYIKFIYDYLGADAVTLNPYPGQAALQPFIDLSDKGCFIICRTANLGSEEIQNLSVEQNLLYQAIIMKVLNEWNTNNNCMIYAGITSSQELTDIRKNIGDMIMLIPGVGARGEELDQVVKSGIDSQQAGLIITVSKTIIYASNDSDFFIKSRKLAQKFKSKINEYRGQPDEQKAENPDPAAGEPYSIEGIKEKMKSKEDEKTILNLSEE